MENNFQKECGADAVYTESACEYILPDYQGDIKKILSAEAKVTPSGKFVGNSDVEFAGIVAYDVLYADSEGKLTDASFTSDYEVSLPISEDGYLDAMADTVVQNLSLRLSGPRKITAKCALATRISLREGDTLTVSGSAFEDGHSPEIRDEEILIHSRSFGSGGEREYADEMAKLEGILPEEVEVIAAGGGVTINHAEGVEGGVLLQGFVTFNAIVKVGEQPPFGVKKEIPFEEMIPIEEATAHGFSDASGRLTSVSAAVNADGEGGSVLTVSGVAEYTAVSERNVPLRVVTDAYLKEAESTADFRDFRYDRFLASTTESFTVSGEYTPKEEEDALRDIFLTAAEVRLSEKRVAKNTVTVSGECTVRTVGSTVTEEGGIGYGSVKFSFPFETTLKLPVPIPDDAKVLCILTPSDATAKLNGETIEAECRVVCTLLIAEEKSVRILESLDAGAPYDDTGEEMKITVCYPTPEDTLWSVAKKYHTSVSKVAVDNALTEEVMSRAGESGCLSGVRKLMID